MLLKHSHTNRSFLHKSYVEQVAHWVRVVQGPLAISVTTSIGTFFALVLMYQGLNPEDAGIFTLIIALVQLLQMVAGLGQPTLILRTYTQQAGREFNWARDLTTSMVISLPIVLLVCGIAMLIYEIKVFHALLIFILAGMQISILSETQILNSAQHYAWGNALLRLPNSLLIVPAVMLTWFPQEAVLDIVLILYTVLTAGIFALGLYLLYRLVPLGKRRLTWNERMNGVVFLFTQSSYSMPEQGIVTIAGGLLPPVELAIYGAISILLKPFDLLSSVLRNILTSELIRIRKLRRIVLTSGLWFVGILAFGLVLIFGVDFMSFIYKARFAEGNILIPWLGLAGLFRVVELLPRSYVIGNAEQRSLRRFVLWQAGLAIMILSIGTWFIHSVGIAAIAWTMVLLQIGRFIISSGYDRILRTSSGEA